MADDRNEINNKKTRSKLEAIDENQQWWLKFVPNSERWSDINVSRFLRIYKTYPILWDPTHSFYEDQSRRMKAYNTIARRLNLVGIGKRECIKLMESLKDLYAEEKKIQMIERRCNQKYTPLPSWYRILDEIVECVQQKLANPIRKVEAEGEVRNPWKACCPRLYTEDIWTPEHFKTNVSDWFLTPQDEQLICTCGKGSETNSDKICSTETSSTFYGNSTSNSSSENYPCFDDKLSHSSKMCCSSDTQDSKLSCQCGIHVDEEKMQGFNDREPKKKGGENGTVNGAGNCGDKKRRLSAKTKKHGTDIPSCCSGLEAKCSKVDSFDLRQASTEEIICCGKTDKNSQMSMISKKCKTNKRQYDRKKKLIQCENIRTRLTVCEEEQDVLVDHNCRTESVEESLDGIIFCSPCGYEKLPKFCTTVQPSTVFENGESAVSSKNETFSTIESLETCNSNSHSSSSLSKCISISEIEESDHRLDYQSDPTLCEKCAVDRMPVRELHKNIMHFEDPRMQELDKYCRYKNWDEIYNIKTQVPDEERIEFHIDEDSSDIIRCKEEPAKLNRQNYFPLETDINLFIDPTAYEKARQISLCNKYKREYGLDIEINQPRHHTCELFDTSGHHNPAQLIL